jgi:hypothetical protein
MVARSVGQLVGRVRRETMKLFADSAVAVCVLKYVGLQYDEIFILLTLPL